MYIYLCISICTYTVHMYVCMYGFFKHKTYMHNPYMHVCMYVCMYVCKCKSHNTYTHTHIHAYTQTHIHTYTQTHIHTYTQTHKHTYTQTHIHTYTHTHIHTYTHTHIHTHTHTHTYTHIHTQHPILVCFTAEDASGTTSPSNNVLVPNKRATG